MKAQESLLSGDNYSLYSSCCFVSMETVHDPEVVMVLVQQFTLRYAINFLPLPDGFCSLLQNLNKILLIFPQIY